MRLDTIIYEKDGAVGIIKLNRPPVNAIIPAMYEELLAALQKAREDPDIRVVVIEGEGRCFSVGADIKVSYTAEEFAKWQNHPMQDIARTIVTLDKPTIAACHGYALGAGLELAILCDIRIAAEGCQFGFPEAGVGATISNAGTKYFPLLVGLGKAKELIFTAEFIDAEEAKRLGLVNKVISLEKLHDAAMEMAKKIAKNSPLAVNCMRIAIDRGLESTLEDTLQIEVAMAKICHAETMRLMKAKSEEISKKKKVET